MASKTLIFLGGSFIVTGTIFRRQPEVNQTPDGLSPDRAQALRRLVEELLGGSATLLPNVREAISRTLLPALVPR